MKRFWLGLVTASFLILCLAPYISAKGIRFGFSNQVSPYTLNSQSNAESATTTRFFGTVSTQTSSTGDLGEPNFPWRTLYVGNVSTTGSGTTNFNKLTWVDATGTNTLNIGELPQLALGTDEPFAVRRTFTGSAGVLTDNLYQSGLFDTQCNPSSIANTPSCDGITVISQMPSTNGISNWTTNFHQVGVEVIEGANATGTMGNQYGVEVGAGNLGSGSITGRATAFLDSSVLSGTGPISSYNGFEAFFTKNGTGSLGTRKGVSIHDITGTNNTSTANYGLWIDPLTQGTGPNYAIYAAGGSSTFIGAVSIGHATATTALDVQGTVSSTGLQVGTTGVTADLLPTSDNTQNLGSSAKRWSRLNSLDLFLTSLAVIKGLSITGASTTRAMGVGFSNNTDGAVQAQEYTFPGVGGFNLTTPSLSMIQSTTGTLKLWDTADSRIGDINIRNVTSSNEYIQNFVSSTAAIFSVLPANDVTDNFVCVSATGTLRQETANCTVSSIRFKDHVESLSPVDLLSEVKKLRAVQYHNITNDKQEEGFIAEEVAMIDPMMVAWEEGQPADIEKVHKLYPDLKLPMKDGKTMIPKTVDYMRISVLEAGAIQAEDDRITKLEHRVGLMERLYQSLKAFVHSIRL